MVLTSIKIHSLKKCLFEDSKLKQETKKYKINVCFVKRFYVENVKSNKIPKFIKKMKLILCILAGAIIQSEALSLNSESLKVSE